MPVSTHTIEILCDYFNCDVHEVMCMERKVKETKDLEQLSVRDVMGYGKDK